MLVTCSNSPQVRKLLSGFPPVKECVYFLPLQRHIQILDGVMIAFRSNSQFICLVNELKDKLKDSVVFQIGTHHGAITASLARHCKELTGKV